VPHAHVGHYFVVLADARASVRGTSVV
jgi:hypothetical protein